MRVRVPATIANLGPGFDLLALAVDLWLEVEAEPAGQPEWAFSGEGAGWLPTSPHAFSALNMRGRIHSQIPVGVGLGSSAAARIAALALGGVSFGELVAQGAALEGHGDNVAAAVHGGLVLAVDGHVHPLPLPQLEVALFVASRPVATEAARAILPVEVPREDAIHNAGRLALLTHAVHTSSWELLPAALADRLHQPHRTQLYPWLPAAIEAARLAGGLGAALAGAGPSVVAFCEPGSGSAVAAAMAAACEVEGRQLVTRPVSRGLEIG
jgi:homoserine kinase